MSSKTMERMERLIASCKRCVVVDKPFLKYEAYSWLPQKTKILAVGESPPPREKNSVFYNLNLFDRLRLSMKLILDIDKDLEVLKKLKKSSVFFTAAVKCRPVNQKKIQVMRVNCLPILREEIRLLKPKKIVAMGKTASTSITEILGLNQPKRLDRIIEAEAKNIKIFFTPHPNYIFRFKRNLTKKIKNLIEC